MNTRQTLLLAAVTAFTTGLLTGMLFAPRAGRDVRRLIARKAQDQARRLGDQLHAAEDQLQAASRHFQEKMRETTQGAVEQIVPTMPEDDASWQLEAEELTRNLRRMPRK